MTQTFTPCTPFTEKPSKSKSEVSIVQESDPSDFTIRNILNFSKNLEIHSSRLLPAIEVVKS